MKVITPHNKVTLTLALTALFATTFIGMVGAQDNATDKAPAASGQSATVAKAKVGNMTAAKYTLEGEIVSIVKNNGATKDVWYKMTLKVYNVEDGSIEWQEEKEIRKTSKR